ncbi:hypothetical protein [Frankia tisae]|nr:hypothetical protein [Frankia tisae]
MPSKRPDDNIICRVERTFQTAAAHLYPMDNSFVTGTVLTVDGGALLL